jgi:hypothetical protein
MKSTPGLEAREAARFAGYTWEEYDALPGASWWQGENDRDCKAFVLVHYRMQGRLDAVVRDLEIKSMKKNGSKKK